MPKLIARLLAWRKDAPRREFEEGFRVAIAHYQAGNVSAAVVESMGNPFNPSPYYAGWAAACEKLIASETLLARAKLAPAQTEGDRRLLVGSFAPPDFEYGAES